MNAQYVTLLEAEISQLKAEVETLKAWQQHVLTYVGPEPDINELINIPIMRKTILGDECVNVSGLIDNIKWYENTILHFQQVAYNLAGKLKEIQS